MRYVLLRFSHHVRHIEHGISSPASRSLRRGKMSLSACATETEGGLEMNDIEVTALMVSRVCHDLFGPLGSVVNGLEVLEDERDAAMREDALKLVASSANQALA